jgi:hypothetical protein
MVVDGQSSSPEPLPPWPLFEPLRSSPPESSSPPPRPLSEPLRSSVAPSSRPRSSVVVAAPVQRGSFACSASSHGPLTSSPASRPVVVVAAAVVVTAVVPATAPAAPAQRGSFACSASSHGPLTSSPASRPVVVAAVVASSFVVALN